MTDDVTDDGADGRDGKATGAWCMQRRGRRLVVIAATMAAAPLLGGCLPIVAMGALATAGVATVQERPISAAVDDAAITFKVKDQLLTRSDALFGRVSVDSVEGRVLLTGTVASAEDREEAGRITEGVAGVRAVYNELQVTPGGGVGSYLNDARISNQLRVALLGNHYINAVNYSVETVNGVVYLTGIAVDQAELDRVADIARRISGVNRVVSYVILKDDPRRRG